MWRRASFKPSCLTSSYGRRSLLSTFLSVSERNACPAFGPHSRALSTTSTATATSTGWSSEAPKLSKVLVANRGEIACRVIRTCRQWGIPTVALYSQADGRDALHAVSADEAYWIGTGPTPAESYLRQDEILQIALETGATAIHPGYGFLSENADFCEKVHQAGLIFVGPPAQAITSMGSKSEAKRVMEAAGVPVTPGYAGSQEMSVLQQEADAIGYPVLIKAVAGGGGKGMRLVWEAADFSDSLDACRREAAAAFGDDAVILEKYLIRPRHVEVQVLADQAGNTVHLYERDCSLQRRHQKVIEEAPASDLSDELRARLGAMGVAAAEAVGYVNAGTVEFLLDSSGTTTTDENGQEDPAFYFCEVNTRLQVEHPVTELVTGLDLVEWQLRVAAGESLPFRQEDIPCQGHAFEARVYAENPARNFLPATGTLWHCRPPAPPNQGAVDGVRVDTGLVQGQDVSVYYDPMIAKLIVYDIDRRSALRKLAQALREYQVAGVPTNLEFLLRCARHETFQQAGATNTGFLEDYADDVRMSEIASVPTWVQAVAACAIQLHLECRVGARRAASRAPWSSEWHGWRMGGASSTRTMRLIDSDSSSPMSCTSRPDGSYDIQVNSPEEEFIHVDGRLATDGSMEVVVNGTRRVRLATALKDNGTTIRVYLWPEHSDEEVIGWEVEVAHPLVPAAAESTMAHSGAGSVKAPMPGRIRRVNVSIDDVVEAGEVVLVMEAMKMEHALTAPRSGVVRTLMAGVDDVVADGSVLMVIDHPTEETKDSKDAA